MADQDDYSAFIASAPSSADLAQVSVLAAEMQAAEAAVADAEAKLREAQYKLRDVQEKRLPELMERLRLTEFVTAGVRIKVEPVVSASPLKENRDKAWTWLEENGHGGLVKRQMSVSFARGEDDKAAAVREALKDNPNFQEERWVEPATLTKFVKDEMSEGRSVPMDLFGVRSYQRAKLKPVKKKGPF